MPPAYARCSPKNSNDGDEDDFRRILLPVLSSRISPVRPSTTSSSYCDTSPYETLFVQSCAQLHRDIAHQRWPFCPIYLLHINTYCHVDRLAIPAEVALVETTFWPQLFANDVDIRSMNLPRKIGEHYERYLHLYKRFWTITEDFHDFIHPGDQLPTGYQADILQHSRRTHGLPCTPYGKIGTEDYNQVLNDLHEMLGLLCDFPTSMPMFCTMESFRSTKAALDWLYAHPSTRDRTENYTLYPIESLIAVLYEHFYPRAELKCNLGILMGKTPQQPVLHARACDYHAILENKHCAMAHVRDLATHYISIVAYLFYNYCDQNSGRLLPYIKVTYQGNLSLQQEAYWSGRNQGDPRKHAEMSTGERGVSFECTRVKKCEQSRAGKCVESSLNPLAVPFSLLKVQLESSLDAARTPAQLVLFEPRDESSQKPSCQTVHQRMHHRPREDWDKN